MRCSIEIFLLRLATATLLASSFLAGAGAADSPAERLARGAERFHEDCAVCHGEDGRGLGPLATELRTAPPNLRLLSSDNDGVFPREYVRRAIDGRDLPPAAHGTLEMPAWGSAYRRSLAGRSEEQVQIRIEALLAWLASIQDE